MTKIVSFTRVLNEDDIIEAFVRHHAGHVDEMLFLDNGSTDQTLEILKALRAEGFPLKVFGNHAVSFDEIAINSWGYLAAAQLMGADWVVFLDADEFVATPDSVPLVTLLPQSGQLVSVKLVNYGQVGGENMEEAVIPWRLRWHYAGETNVTKIMVKARIPGLVVGGWQSRRICWRARIASVAFSGRKPCALPTAQWLAGYAKMGRGAAEGSGRRHTGGRFFRAL